MAKRIKRAWFDLKFAAPDTEGVLAVGSLFLFGVSLGVVMFFTIPEKNEKYVMLLLGALIGVVKDTFGRYFQATKGAQEQRKAATDLTAKLADTAAAVAATASAVQSGDGKK